MFKIIRESLRPGIVTTSYPAAPAEISSPARGRPEIDWANLRDIEAVTASCPTAAFSSTASGAEQLVRFDLARCTYCGLCAEASSAIRMTNHCECAVQRREALITTGRYGPGRDSIAAVEGELSRDQLSQGHPTPPRLIAVETSPDRESTGLDRSVPPIRTAAEIGREIQQRAARRFGRSLHIREVDAGSCNGCEVEIVNLTGPIYDLERFGIHFVASPRHADLLLVTGPVTRNMELALRKTYDAMPTPRLVVAVGTCGCSGGMFGQNYATCGGIDAVLPVDVYIPGCPPNPHALLQGLLLAVGRWPESQAEQH